MKYFFKFFSLFILIVTLYSFSPTVLAVDGWMQQTGSGSRTWRAIASSSDGTKLVAAVGGGYIYTSTDSGVTWTERTSAGSRNWYGLASSADGLKLVATVGEGAGYIYTSTDGGVTWTERTSGGSNYWLHVSSSADGTKLFATTDSTDDGYLYTSTDSGVTWTQQTAVGQLGIWPTASSSDGTKLVAATYGGSIYRSTNSGVTWNAMPSAGTAFWFSVTSSADGTKLAATSCVGYIYTSTDSGTTWTQRTAPGTACWESITYSPDGSKLFVLKGGAGMYVSTDDGATWTQQSGVSTTGGYWRMIASSTDGSKASFVNNPGYIYTYGTLTPATVTTGSATSIGDNTATLGGTITDVGVGGVGGGVTVRGFEYGLTTSYGSTASDSGSYSTGAYTKDISSLTCDTLYHFRAYVTSPAGTSYGSDNTFTTVCPYVSSVSSSNDNAPYFPNATISTTITFSESVTVTGTPQLTLETGDTNRTATYTSGSGTNTLTFTYTVQPGDHTLDLDYTNTTALTLNGGTIKDSSTNDANLTLPQPGASGSLSYNKNIEIAFPAAVSLPSITHNTTIPPPATVPNTPNIPVTTPTTPTTAPTTPTPASCPTLGDIPPILKLKLSHPNVKTLQQLLNCKGYTISTTGAGSPGKETTKFGLLTYKAVKAFQAARSIKVDGIVGVETREAFMR